MTQNNPVLFMERMVGCHGRGTIDAPTPNYLLDAHRWFGDRRLVTDRLTDSE
jgi:hypothetical protein